MTVAAAGLLASSMALAQQQQPQSQQAKPGGAVPLSVTAGAIAANPEKYYGQKVAVRAEVEDVLGPQVFLLDEERLFAWPDVLVVAPRLSGVVPEDEIVTVTGTVRAFSDADFRRDYDWAWWNDLDPDIYVTFRTRPAIVADSIRTSAGLELVRDMPKK